MHSLMDHRCTIRRNTPVDTSGKITAKWDDAATGVACLLQEDRGRTRIDVTGRVADYDATLYVDIGADIRPQGNQSQPDVIVMTAPARMAGRTFEVLFAVDESGMGDHVTAYLKARGPVL